jgi:deoxyadenosine/deoxycytidine kinase
MAPILISIEGNIGSGKSTLLEHLKTHVKAAGSRKIIYVDEPVSEWNTITDENNRGMLELFYENPKKYAFSFQMMAYISRLANMQNAIKNHPNHIILMERSLLTDYHVFAEMLHEKGDLLHEEFAIYRKWFHHFNTIPMDGLIYLETSPEVALERCQKRNRQGETISLEYLQELHERHETWIHEVETRPYLHVNNDSTDIDDILFAVEDFLEETSMYTDDVGYFMNYVYSSYSYSRIMFCWFLFTIYSVLKKA